MSLNNDMSEKNQIEINDIFTSNSTNAYYHHSDKNGDIEEYLSGFHFTKDKVNYRIGYLENYKLKIKLLKILNLINEVEE